MRCLPYELRADSTGHSFTQMSMLPDTPRAAGGSGSNGGGAGGFGGRGGGFGFCGIAVLLFASRSGHDPLQDVPADGPPLNRKNMKKEQFRPIRKSIRPATLALLGGPAPPPPRSADNPAALPSRRDFL